ncbi:phage portal protein [Thiocystis violacea]|uniref:phage portal protein n=1 Tax=Thiocystis violacea TaxID=13725 RepID=UPI0019034106|nr:phage portal protein [Thiocystis violacea]MBK1719219.1 phage portal protein [Thiocystis violacea]
MGWPSFFRPKAQAATDTAHDAASRTTRGLETWLPRGGSADADLLPELASIANRSRDLERNHPLAAGYLQTNRDNIVGHVLSLSARPDTDLLGWDIDQGRAWARTVRAQWRTWAESPECDAAASDTLLDLTLQMLTGAFLNGDAVCLPLWIERPGEGWKTKLQIVESDRLATPPHLTHRADIRNGVEIDAHGAPLAYWISRTHPGDSLGLFGLAAVGPDDFQRLPATTPWGRRRVIHLRDKTRAGANRGRPIFSAVIKEFFQAGKYTNAELSASVVNALVAAFIESTMDSTEVHEIFNSAEGGPEAYWRDLLGQAQPRLKEGALIQLPIGARANSFTPGRPNAAFEAFMHAVLRHIAAGLNVPYELLTKDFSQTNYSSARAALLEAWRYFHGRRRWLIDHWLRPVYELWMEEAVNLGRVDAPDWYQLRHAYLRARWVFSGRGWVDPTKEANAAQIRMEIGVSTLEQECAEQGLDWEDVAEQRAFERQRLDELGLAPTDTLAVAALAAATATPEPDQDESSDPNQDRKEEARHA